MTAPAVSVVIVSRHRPNALRKCLLALTFQTKPSFEVVLVGDVGILAVLSDLGFEDRVKFLQFDAPNISEARNLGISAADGEVIAFIDDDSVAEPTWLDRLTTPFLDPKVAAAGGFVRGRNGISYQWKAEVIGPAGESEPLSVDETVVVAGTADRAIKTQGTNCAFRRRILADLGGFDESFHFYMDETDLNIRIGQAGLFTAIVPSAEVQHGYLASARRAENRTPKTLFDEGASQAYFLKKYQRDLGEFDQFRKHQRARLSRSLILGRLEPRDCVRLMKTLDEGYADGLRRESKYLKIAQSLIPHSEFMKGTARPNEFLFGHWRKRSDLFNKARHKAKSGIGVTVLLLSYTTFFHKRRFHDDGFWVQVGGVFGKSLRSDPLFQNYSIKSRAVREFELLKDSRIFHSASGSS